MAGNPKMTEPFCTVKQVKIKQVSHKELIQAERKVKQALWGTVDQEVL